MTYDPNTEPCGTPVDSEDASDVSRPPVTTWVLVKVRDKPGQRIALNIEASIENVGHDPVVNGVKSSGYVEQDKCAHLAAVNNMDHVIVWPHESCFRGMVTTVDRGQRISVSVCDKPAVKYSLYLLQYETKIGYWPIGVRVGRVHR